LLLVALLLAAACASEASRASSRHPGHLSAAAFAFLVGYGQTAEDGRVLDRAEQILDKRCMNRLGFQYILDPSAWQASVDDRPYVPGIGPTRTEALAVAQRMRTGYHLYSAYHPGKVPPNDQYVRSLSPAEQARYVRALFGPHSAYQKIHEPGGGSLSFPTKGCVAKGQRQLYGTPLTFQEVSVFPGDWLAQLGRKTTSEPAVVAKGKPWSRCVTAAIGIHFPTPDAIVERLKREYATEGATTAMHRREIAYAVADARCQFRSGLATVYARIFRQLADQLSRRTNRLLLELLDAERSATLRADQIVPGR
jgi:hypothetical protein